MTKKPTTDDLMRSLIANAPALLRVGVTSLSVSPDGGITATLVQPQSTVDIPESAAQPPVSTLNPMEDASTYPGGRKPGFTRPKKD